MNQQSSSTMFFAGLQWLFFMFANTVVIPITIGDAFDLSSVEVASALQRSFVFTGVACIFQAFIGHKYPLMEGQSGIWWGAILSISASASSAGLTASEIGGGLSVGIILSGILIMVLGALGNGKIIKAFVYTRGHEYGVIFVSGTVGRDFHKRNAWIVDRRSNRLANGCFVHISNHSCRIH